MNGDLEAAARSIQARFQETWTLDGRDLQRPCSDRVLLELIRGFRPDFEDRLKREFFDVGPLEGLLNDPNVTEITVNGREQIWFEKLGHFQKLDDCFLTDSSFKNFIDRLSSEAGVQADLARPFADGRWRGFRAHLVCSPLSNESYHLTLRRLKSDPWTLSKLEAVGWATSSQFTLLRSLLESRQNLMIIGPTGSGKTSVLSACLKSLASDERVVVLEDTDELPVPNAASTKLLSRPLPAPGLSEVTLGDLVRQSLRMRPERLVVGEVRGGEAKDLLLALATGHTGSMGTLHAGDPRQALLRLEMLVQMGAPQWQVSAVRQLILLSVNAIVVCTNKNGHRVLEGIHKVAALESFGFLLEPLA